MGLNEADLQGLARLLIGFGVVLSVSEDGAPPHPLAGLPTASLDPGAQLRLSDARTEPALDSLAARIAGVDGAVAAVLPAAGNRPGVSDRLAAVVRVGDPGKTVAGITAELRKFVPAHMIPGHIVFVEQIPFTVGGKIDRTAVAALLAGSAEPKNTCATTGVVLIHMMNSADQLKNCTSASRRDSRQPRIGFSHGSASSHSQLANTVNTSQAASLSVRSISA